MSSMLLKIGDTDRASMVFVMRVWIEYSVCIDCSSSFV